MRSHRGRGLARGLGLVNGLRGAWLLVGATRVQDLVDERGVQMTRSCRGEDRLIIASGTRHRSPMPDLRLKTNGRHDAPDRGRPASRPTSPATGPRPADLQRPHGGQTFPCPEV